MVFVSHTSWGTSSGLNSSALASGPVSRFSARFTMVSCLSSTSVHDTPFSNCIIFTSDRYWSALLMPASPNTAAVVSSSSQEMPLPWNFMPQLSIISTTFHLFESFEASVVAENSLAFSFTLASAIHLGDLARVATCFKGLLPPTNPCSACSPWTAWRWALPFPFLWRLVSPGFLLSLLLTPIFGAACWNVSFALNSCSKMPWNCMTSGFSKRTAVSFPCEFWSSGGWSTVKQLGIPAMMVSYHPVSDHLNLHTAAAGHFHHPQRQDGDTSEHVRNKGGVRNPQH